MNNILIVDFDMSVKGGIEKVVTFMANRLCKTFNVEILTIADTCKCKAFDIDDSIKVTSLNMQGNIRVREMFSKCYKPIRKYILKNKIDVVFFTGTYVGAVGAVSTIGLRKVKTVFCDHGALCNQLDDKVMTNLRKIAYKFTDKTVVLTNKSKKDYMDIMNGKEKKLQCIYNPMEKYDDIVPKYDISSNKIITVGRMTKEKGFDMLLDIANIVLKKRTDWQWHLYGDGPLFKDLKVKAKSYGIEDKLIFMGMTSNMENLYSDYAMYVLPSYREGLPIVLLEAQYNKLPIVSFDVETGPNEIITDGVNGYLIEKYNINEMANKIVELMDDKEKRLQFSEASQMHIDRFDEDKIIIQWENLIKNLMEA